eukprot:CAMPEP_0113486964 /NCGR_PEP_ID=MMETSP0014_2-20120614/25268_1 /TAXON_ID=2857 /ORGANISM="Nitzschia sp." /LENGTH=402 /DNA_ID=CAMNT_0000380653 /DNA_START=88 /DNA_END=1296 /DNA_ORIENTATION=+ /assembly_acc=CAM_ASM_000159
MRLSFHLATALVTVLSTSATFTTAFSPQNQKSPGRCTASVLFNNGPTLGAGGMADTRDPDALKHEDPRKSISAAPSFEEYLKMREGGGGGDATPTAAAPDVPVPAPATAAPAPAAPAPTSTAGSSGTTDSFKTSQVSTVSKIAAAIPELETKPDFTWTESSAVSVAAGSATLDARDAPGPANVAWLSALDVSGTFSSLTIFNGPLTDVPHLVSRVFVDDGSNKLRFTVDFRPRAYGAYEMKKPDGTYPGPDELGRKSFEYSGARAEFDSKFGTAEVQEFISSLSNLDGATSYDPSPTELDLLTRGPLYTCLEMALNDNNVNAIVAAREKIVDYWLEWRNDPQNEHRPGAPVNSQYVYDTKFKQNCFGCLQGEYTALFGSEDGKTLAVGDSGPLDEAYVGGGS